MGLRNHKEKEYSKAASFIEPGMDVLEHHHYSSYSIRGSHTEMGISEDKPELRGVVQKACDLESRDVAFKT